MLQENDDDDKGKPCVNHVHCTVVPHETRLVATPSQENDAHDDGGQGVKTWLLMGTPRTINWPRVFVEKKSRDLKLGSIRGEYFFSPLNPILSHSFSLLLYVYECVCPKGVKDLWQTCLVQVREKERRFSCTHLLTFEWIIWTHSPHRTDRQTVPHFFSPGPHSVCLSLFYCIRMHVHVCHFLKHMAKCNRLS